MINKAFNDSVFSSSERLVRVSGPLTASVTSVRTIPIAAAAESSSVTSITSVIAPAAAESSLSSTSEAATAVAITVIATLTPFAHLHRTLIALHGALARKLSEFRRNVSSINALCAVFCAFESDEREALVVSSLVHRDVAAGDFTKHLHHLLKIFDDAIPSF